MDAAPMMTRRDGTIDFDLNDRGQMVPIVTDGLSLTVTFEPGDVVITCPAAYLIDDGAAVEE